jgi:hypothetical protein
VGTTLAQAGQSARQHKPTQTWVHQVLTNRCVLLFNALQDIVLNLLFVGADTRLKDARGFDVMVEAARGGHSDVIDVLTRGGAKAGISGVLQVRSTFKNPPAVVEVPPICGLLAARWLGLASGQGCKLVCSVCHIICAIPAYPAGISGVLQVMGVTVSCMLRMLGRLHVVGVPCWVVCWARQHTLRTLVGWQH